MIKMHGVIRMKPTDVDGPSALVPADRGRCQIATGGFERVNYTERSRDPKRIRTRRIIEFILALAGVRHHGLPGSTLYIAVCRILLLKCSIPGDPDELSLILGRK